MENGQTADIMGNELKGVAALGETAVREKRTGKQIVGKASVITADCWARELAENTQASDIYSSTRNGEKGGPCRYSLAYEASKNLYQCYFRSGR